MRRARLILLAAILAAVPLRAAAALPDSLVRAFGICTEPDLPLWNRLVLLDTARWKPAQDTAERRGFAVLSTYARKFPFILNADNSHRARHLDMARQAMAEPVPAPYLSSEPPAIEDVARVLDGGKPFELALVNPEIPGLLTITVGRGRGEDRLAMKCVFALDVAATAADIAALAAGSGFDAPTDPPPARPRVGYSAVAYERTEGEAGTGGSIRIEYYAYGDSPAMAHAAAEIGSPVAPSTVIETRVGFFGLKPTTPVPPQPQVSP